MKATIVVIGDEILLGRVTDTNSGDIARALDPLGWQICRVVTVGDDALAIRQSIEQAMSNSDLVLITGGLGPTKDDITKSVLCQLFGGELQMDADVLANVEAQFARRGLAMNDSTRRQALVPSSCRVLPNNFGTAPVMWFERDGHVAVSMPGVPHEMRSVLAHEVIPAIKRYFKIDIHTVHRTLMVSGITESGLSEKLADWEESLAAGFHLAYLPNSPIITLRIDGVGALTDAQALDKQGDDLLVSLKNLLGDLFIAEGNEPVAKLLFDALRAHHLTLATAESCTGGNVAHAITSIPGSSDVFEGGVVSYSNDVKMHVLGVLPTTLDEFGAVSRLTIGEMLAGAINVIDTTCAIATSGIAGPGGGTPEKPVGTVWIGAYTPKGGGVTELLHCPGNRQRVIERATTSAILLLLKQINSHY